MSSEHSELSSVLSSDVSSKSKKRKYKKRAEENTNKLVSVEDISTLDKPSNSFMSVENF